MIDPKIVAEIQVRHNLKTMQREWLYRGKVIAWLDLGGPNFKDRERIVLRRLFGL